MKTEKFILFAAAILILTGMAAAQTSNVFQSSQANYQYSEPSFQNFYSSQGIDYTMFWPDANNLDTCQPGNDFFVTVVPGGCSPAVVRSDLLESQNVPVFCKMSAVKINPLMNIAQIRTVGFSGKYPQEVSGVGYHPSQAALIPYASTGSNVLNDVGYVVVVLKRQLNEKNMSDSVRFNLTANIQYDLSNIVGIGKAAFFLPVLKDEDWANDYIEYGFWNNKGYIRADYVDANSAKVSIYQDKDTVIRSFDLKLGGTSDIIYVPGFYCRGGLRIRLDTVGVPKASALLQVDDEQIRAVQGTTFLGNCYMGNIQNKNNNWNVDVACEGKKYTLTWSELGSKTQTGVGVDAQTENYFEKAQKTANEIVNFYSGETDANTKVNYGADAMIQLAKLATSIGKSAEAKSIYETIVQKYPDTEYANTAKVNLETVANYDLSNARAVVNVKGVNHIISLIGKPKLPGAEDASAEFKVGDQTVTFGVGEAKLIGGANIVLKGLGDDYADIEYVVGKNPAVSKRAMQNEAVVLSGSTAITLTNVHLNKVAGIEILPEFPNQVSSVNFSVNIGIEKRGIQLSPAKTQEMIDNLNKSIKQYSNIADKLETWVDVQSKACYATSLIMLFKNLGKGFARSRVMTDAGGWNDYCDAHKNDGDKNYGGSFNNCILQNADKISKSVDNFDSQVKAINDKISADETAVKGTKTSYEQRFIQTDFADFAAKPQNQDLTIKIGNEEKKLSDVFGTSKGEIISNTQNMYGNGTISFSDIKDIMLYGGLDNQGVTGAISANKLNALVGNVYTAQANKAALSAITAEDKIAGLDIASANRGTAVEVKIAKAPESWASTAPLLKNSKVTLLFVPQDVGANVKDPQEKTVVQGYAGKVLAIPVVTKGNFYAANPAIPAYVYNNKITVEQVDSTSVTQILQAMGVPAFTQSSQTQCGNKYTNPSIKYYDSGIFKGKAEVVPVDVAKGWYVATKPDIYGVGKPYTDAGQAMSYYLCNVGPNGMEEFEKSSNDDTNCIGINVQTGQPLNQLGACFTPNEAQTIATKARSLLEQANARYGSKQVTIGSGTFTATAASSVVGAKCTDFMDPKDCNILFNVCDPVLCPNSRCNLGGTYSVSDVIQSGIIGGMFLCLPNIKEGIIMPVCLTGIKEGIKGWVSLMQGHRDCLQESLTTGKQVGICNEMYSVYGCEYIWRQVGPLLDVGVVKIVSLILGQGHGGGEYMTVNYAWDSMKSSVSYLQQHYSNSIPRIFKIRSVSEAGSEVCKGFVSANYPVIGGLADTLLNPESPVQFSAWFDEIPFTEATVPPTSQYKVYYHIYAGTDVGSYYSVYLASPPETGYYVQQAQYVLASGYVNVGGTVDETKDITAPSSYKQLCISINGKEECGFQRISSSFALDYLNDQYMKEQATQIGIETESQCVSGTPSLYSLAQPNIQAGVEEVIQPQIYNRGIVRVCSSTNPGENSNPARWENVGYCDRTKGLYCWTDKDSVKNVIQGTGIENATLTQLEATAKALATNTGQIFTSDDTAAKLNDLGGIQASQKTIAQIEKLADEIVQKGFSNQQKANALYLEFKAYVKIMDDTAAALVYWLKTLNAFAGEIKTLWESGTAEISDFLNAIVNAETTQPAATTVGEGCKIYQIGDKAYQVTGDNKVLEFADGKWTDSSLPKEDAAKGNLIFSMARQGTYTGDPSVWMVAATPAAAATIKEDYLKVLAGLSIYEVDVGYGKEIIGTDYAYIGKVIKKDKVYFIEFGDRYNAIKSLTGSKPIIDNEAQEILCNFRYNYKNNDGSSDTLFPLVFDKPGAYPVRGKLYKEYSDKDCNPTFPGKPYVSPKVGELPKTPAIITVRFAFDTSIKYTYDRSNAQWMADGTWDGKDWRTLKDIFPDAAEQQQKIIQTLYNLKGNDKEKQGYECFAYLRENKPTGFFTGLEEISGAPYNFEQKKCFDF